MATSEAFAPAKVNLTLHVTGQRADGYHLLDSLVVFADVGDRLWFETAPSMSLEVTGPFSVGVPEDDRNLVWRAAECAGKSLRIRLEKNLPHGAGIGGGSADAAAVLRTFEAAETAPHLGADVPVCLSNRPQRMQGVGERLVFEKAVPVCDLVLVNPAVPVATPDVFRALEKRNNSGMGEVPEWASKQAFVQWLGRQRNDLQKAAQSIAPVISDALIALEDALIARMSGSGSTCFGLYPDASAAVQAASRISAANPGWWVQHTKSIGSK